MNAREITTVQPLGELSTLSIPAIASSTLSAFREILLKAGYASTDASEENASHGILKSLFARGIPVHADEVHPVIDLRLRQQLTESGLLEERDGLVRARFQVQAEAGMFFISDFMKRNPPADLVLAIGPSGRHLASLTIRKKIGSALDLGCGCGIQSLLATRHADLVTATDINPRALMLTRLNAQFNAITNIEMLEGSHFGPVNGQKFDLIVANLPYVVSPKRKYVYRDSDQPGDLSVRNMLVETPGHLNEGGFAHIVITWIDRAGEPWWALANEMLQCPHTDSWLNHNGTKTPEEYAAMWISIDPKKEPEKYSAEMRAWTGWYRSMGYYQFGLGSMTLRRRSNGKNWSSAIEVKKFLSNPLGMEVARLFQNQDELESHADLLSARFLIRNLEIDLKKSLARTRKGFLFQTRLTANAIKTVNELANGVSLHEAMLRAVGAKISSEDHDQILSQITQLINFGMIMLRGPS